MAHASTGIEKMARTGGGGEGANSALFCYGDPGISKTLLGNKDYSPAGGRKRARAR